MIEIWSPNVADDLLNFVMFMFPWGKAGTPLANQTGPRAWQREELNYITEHIKNNKLRMELGQAPFLYRSATASGRGVGKSALVAWLVYWMMSTRIGSSTIVTANTEMQLKTRTWAELGKWHTLAINSHWFERQAMSLKPQVWFENLLIKDMKIDKTYYSAIAQLWAEENPDAFAGLHNHNGMLVLFDEASGIPAPIWTVTDGFFSDLIENRFLFAFSNPRRNTGDFYECFHKHKKYWNTRNLDSRHIEGTDHAVLNQIVEKYGEESDQAKVEVKGQFPNQGDRQFISREVVEDAQSREIEHDKEAGLIMGVDVARFGSDKSVIYFRQGRDAKSIAPIKLVKKDNMAVANEVAEWINRVNPDAVCVDAGSGTGIIDRLRELKYKVHEVWMGGKSDEDEWGNKKTELWDKMRTWLKGGSISMDPELAEGLTAPEYRNFARSDKIILETKEEMRARGLSSPDVADALSLTFFVNVGARGTLSSRIGPGKKARIAKDVDYKMF